jgi:hypothetical protein
MEELQVTGTYKEFKTSLDTELSKAAEGFVKIGYLLRIAKDTDILHESGYATVADFAKAEYGLTKDIVSRYMAINERFSEGGYSEKLKEEYKGYGIAKLAEMLTLPDSVVESMSPLMTKAEIQEVKKEIKKEEKVTDIEVMLEEKKDFQKNLSSELKAALRQYYYEWKDQYCTIWNTFADPDRDKSGDIDKILDVMAPSGVKVIGTRPAGMGSVMISIRGKDKDIDVIITRQQRTEHYTWPEIILEIESICKCTETPQESWEEVFGEKYEVAPVQQEKQEVKEETKEVKSEQKREEQKIVPKEQKEPKGNKPVETEEQIPGQANIEDYKEVLPDTLKEQQEEEKEPEIEQSKESEPEHSTEEKSSMVVVEEKHETEKGCAFCRGEETFASHDGVFTLKLTDKGYISVKMDNGETQELAIFEFKYCPNCGKQLEKE